jgi:hypothetical protein
MFLQVGATAYSNAFDISTKHCVEKYGDVVAYGSVADYPGVRGHKS